MICACMIYFYYGEETFQTALAVSAVRAQSSDDVVMYDCTDAYNVEDILYTLRAQSLFASRRTIILSHIFAHAPAADQKQIIAALQQPTEDTIIITEHKIPRKNAALFVWLLQHATVKAQHDPITGAALDRWMRARMAHYGLAAEPAAQRALAVAAGTDLRRLDGEIAKLALYVNGGTCTVDDVHTMVGDAMERDLFATIAALCAQDRGQALRLLHEQRMAGDAAGYIFAMYAYQVRVLIRVASAVEQGGVRDAATIATMIGVHPFVAKKSLAIARRVSLARLKTVHHMMVIFDREIKTGRRDINTALDMLVMHA